jgi:hypothetical protein
VKRLDYAMIRVPHALRPFATLGDQLAALWLGGITDVQGAFTAVLGSVMFNWNPIGGNDLVSMALPLVLDPVYDLTRNRDSLGREIVPEGFGGEGLGVPAYNWQPGQTAPAFISAARTVNTATGGNSVTPGYVSIPPDYLEYVWEFTAGGLGRFASETTQVTANKIEGVETPPNRIPILRTTLGRTTDRVQTDRFYETYSEGAELAERLTETKRKVKLGELGDAEWQQVLDLADQLGVTVVSPEKDVKWKGSWIDVMRKAKAQTDIIRDEIRSTLNRTDISRVEAEALVKEMQGRQEAIRLEARTRVLDMRSQLPTP